MTRQSLRAKMACETCPKLFQPFIMWTFACAGMAILVRSASPWLLASFHDLKNLQSTCHGPRRGPALVQSFTVRLPACPGAERTRNDPRPEEENVHMCKQNIYNIVIYVRGTARSLRAYHRRSPSRGVNDDMAQCRRH